VHLPSDVRAPVSGGAAGYAGLSDEQRLAKQKAAHELGADLGAAEHKKAAAALGMVDPWGRNAWQIVMKAGGAGAFKGASVQEEAALLEQGEASWRDTTTATTAGMDVIAEAHSLETARFETILSELGGMDHKAIQKWLQNPPRTIGKDAGETVVKKINLQAIRAMATAQYGHPIGDEEWVQMSQQPEWRKCLNSKHMGAKLAAERATKIFEILRNGPLQLALDYMAAALRTRRRNEMATKREPQKKK